MKRRQVSTKSIALFLLGSWIAIAAPSLAQPAAENTGNADGIEVGDLKVEHLRAPILLDVSKPRFSWILRPVNGAAKNVRQQSYHVLVASDEATLAEDRGDLWDSGVVSSSQSVLVPYQGQDLVSRQQCFWKVRTTDNQGHTSDWSDTAKWEMGLLKADDWSGSQWIGFEDKKRDHPFAGNAHRNIKAELFPHPSPLLRKEIAITKPIANAKAFICGVGLFEFYLNGHKIGDHVLDPGQTNYDKHTLYVAHDVTEALQQGDNAVGIWLGNGFYGQNIAFGKRFGYGQPGVRMKLFIDYKDGTSDQFNTDTTWKATGSPIVFDNIYWGESYDARLEIPDWSQPGIDLSDWDNAVTVRSPCPDKNLRPQLLPPIKVMQQLRPVEIRKVAEETWQVDFGKNIAGWPSITVNQNAGDVLRITSSEVLDKKTGRTDNRTQGGSATGSNNENIYICKGGSSESWAPRFSYTGFQFIEISGLDQAPAFDDVSAMVVHSAVPKTGSFTCSNELLNQQFTTSLLTLEVNWHSFPEDCPHREKCGWLGDAHATADLSLYNYDISAFYKKFLYDIQDSLTSNGQTEKVLPPGAGIPTFVAPGKRAHRVATIDWAIAYLILPWRTYLHTGDADIFEPHFENLKNFITFYRTFKNDQGVIDNGLGDWCPPRWDRRAAPEFMECHPYVSGTAFYYQALTIVSKMAQILGEDDYSNQCLKEADEIKTAFAKTYLKPIQDTQLKHFGSQTATVMAIRSGMVDPEEIDDRVAALVYDIKQLHDGHHACGIHGLRHLYTVLADQGHDELAHQLLTDTTFPSPGYVLSCGLSTWPERRFEWKKKRYSNSLNHPMNAGFSAFAHESLAGIRPTTDAPGYQHFQLKPHLTKQLKWINAEILSPYGPIRSHWKNQDGTFNWEVEVPVNTTATIFIPNPNGRTLYESGKPYQGSTSSVTQSKQDWIKTETGSGLYRFSLK